MNLYEISAEYCKVLDELSEMEGITEEIISDTLSPVKDDFNNKAIAVTSYFKNLEAEVHAIREAEKSMADRRRSIERRIERMREYLKSQMLLTGINKIKCPYFSITLSKSRGSVNIIDKSKIPDEFMRIIKEPLKELIREAGGCEGAEITENYALTIR